MADGRYISCVCVCVIALLWRETECSGLRLAGGIFYSFCSENSPKRKGMMPLR